MITDIERKAIIRELGDGLILRRSTQEDAEALATFNAAVHSEQGPDKPDERVAAWTRDLLTRPHPTFHPDDFTIVGDVHSGKIVSSMNLISQTWSYAGITFGVGRPELVGTLPEYRKRGLIRLQFEEVHKWSAERGELVQAITGIPFYYRQFGYEMGLELGGGRTGFEMMLPKLEEGESEPYVIRPATEADIPFIMQVYAHACQRSLIAGVWDEANWHYELTGMSEKNVNRGVVRIIQRDAGEAVGFLMHPWFNWSSGLIASFYELKPGVSWMAVTPSVARYLWQTGGEYAAKEGNTRTSYAFWLGTQHPVYEVFREKLPHIRDPYTWYLRVPDVAGFLRHIAPVLERRVAESFIPGYSGEVKISFYCGGLQLVFERGRLTGIEDFSSTSCQAGNAAFPDLSFLQLLFGYRSFEELEQSYADCWYDKDEIRVLLDVLFPKQPSLVLGVV